MSFKTSLVAAAIGSLAAGSALAADGSVHFYSGVSAESTGGSHWSVERMRAAKPMNPVRNDGVSPMSAGSSTLDFTRSRITPRSANKAAPYKMAGKLFFTIPGEGDFQCTASVIKKRIVVTAGHCVYSDGVGYHTDFEFIPGYDGSQATLAAQRPFGTWSVSGAIVPNNWINTHGSLPNNTDFALLEAVDQSFGGAPAINVSQEVGGMFTPVTGSLADTHVTMLGYPCNFDSCNILQRNDSGDHRPASDAAGNNAYEYGSDMTGGSSGGPWVVNLGDPAAAAPQGTKNRRNGVVGVTSYGYNDPGVLILGASQFNATFTSILNTICGSQAGNC